MKIENELVSVIIPIYNVEKYLAACIESVQKQTYHNLEMILIDDGSTDGSGKICDEYAKTDNRITVIHQVNHGISQVRNRGVKETKKILREKRPIIKSFCLLLINLLYSMQRAQASISILKG